MARWAINHLSVTTSPEQYDLDFVCFDALDDGGGIKVTSAVKLLPIDLKKRKHLVTYFQKINCQFIKRFELQSEGNEIIYSSFLLSPPCRGPETRTKNQIAQYPSWDELRVNGAAKHCWPSRFPVPHFPNLPATFVANAQSIQAFISRYCGSVQHCGENESKYSGNETKLFPLSATV